MIERIVENWLNNINEIAFTIPFAQKLILNDYTVIHITTHGPMEQGKDIITIDPNGVPCAFQLKAVTITLNVWRDIKGEIDELIEVPINHPSIDKGIKHRAVLVTTKRINEEVRLLIDDLNPVWEKRGFSKLELITGTELLKDFVKVHGKFLPTELEDFRLFIELYFFNGKDLLDKNKLSQFFETIMFKETSNKNEIKRMISSTILLCQYILLNYERLDNHIQIIESLILLTNYILYIVEKNELENTYWRNSFNLIIDRVIFQLEKLKAEFYEKENYLEPGWDGGFIYKARITIILGWLSAYELIKKILVPNYELDKLLLTKIKDNVDNLWYWGESATPFFIMVSKFCDVFEDVELSDSILIDILTHLVVNNNKSDGRGVPNPYYDVEQVLEFEYDLPGVEYDKSDFLGHSYHLNSFYLL